jgi:hypothetical protein
MELLPKSPLDSNLLGKEEGAVILRKVIRSKSCSLKKSREEEKEERERERDRVRVRVSVRG